MSSYVVGTGIQAMMTRLNDEPATDELFSAGMSEATGTSGLRYVYIMSLDKVFVYAPLPSPEPLPERREDRWVVMDGVRLRSAPGLNSEILRELSRGTRFLITAAREKEVDGYVWAYGQVNGQDTFGWVASEFLTTIQPPPLPIPDPLSKLENRWVTHDEVRFRAAPGLGGEILKEMSRGTWLVVNVTNETVFDGQVWEHGRIDDQGEMGWVVSEFLSNTPPPPNDRAYTFDELWPKMQAAGKEFDFDPRVIMAIAMQESGLRNWRVHHDGTGHGLFGLDDNGLLPEFERWSGTKVGRGVTADIIPVESQLRYAAYQLNRYEEAYGNDKWAAARAWHRGGGLMNDNLGRHYERLIRNWVDELFYPISQYTE